MKLVKICGLKLVNPAEVAIESGANLLGMILVPGRARTIPTEDAKMISQEVQKKRQEKDCRFKYIKDIIEYVELQEYDDLDGLMATIDKLIQENGPFSVGVFRNQPINEVFKIAEEIGIDIIQLHGNENKIEYCHYNQQNFDKKYGIIGRFTIPQDMSNIYATLEEILIGGKYFGCGFLVPLLDSEMGGEGKLLDWSLLDELNTGKFLLAGGLNQFNLGGLNGRSNILGFDVSGGVETNGEKDSSKIKNFINASRLIN